MAMTPPVKGIIITSLAGMHGVCAVVLLCCIPKWLVISHMFLIWGEGSFEVRIETLNSESPRPTKMGLHVDLQVIFPKTETNIIFKLFGHIIAQFDTKCPWQEEFSPMLTGKRSNLKVTARRPQGDTTYYIFSLTRILFKLAMRRWERPSRPEFH